ncbi:MAG: hypothetical protein WDW36_000655 [Sanguina aurantia]
MGDLSSMHAQAKRLIMSIKDGLERLELSEASASRESLQGIKKHLAASAPSGLAMDLMQQLTELQRASAELDSSWRMHAVRENSSRRDAWKRKVELVGEEVDSLRTSLEKFTKREARRQVEVDERQELLGRAEAGRAAKSVMDAEAAMMGSVQRSKRALDEIADSGAAILSSMAGGRERLKSAQRKAYDVLNSIGLGESLLKLIERRQRMDIWMTYGGMALVLLIVIFFMWWAWG